MGGRAQRALLALVAVTMFAGVAQPAEAAPVVENNDHWAGYSAAPPAGSRAWYASTVYTEPVVTCAVGGPIQALVIWAGLGGVTPGSLLVQAGSGVLCDGGVPNHFLFWEAFPKTKPVVIDMGTEALRPGDEVATTVRETAVNHAQMDIVVSRFGAPVFRWSFAITYANRRVGTSGECIVETPTVRGNVPSALPNFGVVGFPFDCNVGTVTPAGVRGTALLATERYAVGASDLPPLATVEYHLRRGRGSGAVSATPHRTATGFAVSIP